MHYLDYKIEYGHNHGQGCVIQINYNAIRKVSFVNWSTSDLVGIDELRVIAVWKVKRLKTRAIIDMPPFLIEYN